MENIMAEATRSIIVYLFVEPESSGGFNWTPDTPENLKSVRRVLDEDALDYSDRMIVRAEVPADLDGMDLTDYIDDNLDTFEKMEAI